MSQEEMTQQGQTTKATTPGTTEPVIHRVGTRAILVDLPDLTTVMAWHSALVASPLHGQIDCIAAARTVLVVLDSPRSAKDAATKLANFSPASATQATPRDITINVRYDGEDLQEAAEAAGMTVDELIDWHTSTTFVGAFGGFAPGFTYCVPEDGSPQTLDMPRKATPRTSVPAGAVGLAGEFSAVYPRQSPGGWQLIGTTTDPMWDSAKDNPALIAPGDRVHYRAVETLEERPEQAEAGATDLPRSRPMLRVDEAGMQTLIQDLGRAGNGGLGVTTSGAADEASARAANAAVGNEATAAVLENIGGMQITALADSVVALTGAEAPARIGNRPIPLAMPVMLPAGKTLEVQPATVGMRSYLAIRGGVIEPLTLGSASADLLSGLGPQPLQAGRVLRSQFAPTTFVDNSRLNPLLVNRKHRVDIRVVPGPRDSWFADGVAPLEAQQWVVTAASNRIGLRLDGVPIERTTTGELPSEGIVAGSIQVPTNGLPVVFLRDHAVTGGYPVIATVVHEDLDILAQLPPEALINFIAVDPDTLQPLQG
ncbi:carboxyltransferase domain-containing protein [Corynebacterium auriscanis]|nr:carboxyltransferase domain-containing protein [Corynebacterium auriscanis]MCX2163103.1 carboxyltransferase domain-containing protein [Corynebacterium auriscanis]